MCFPKAKWFSSGIAVLWLLGTAAAFAQETPVIFERTEIRIDPAFTERAPDMPAEVRSASRFSIELRSEDAARLEYIPSLNTLADSEGVMILFRAPILTALPKLNNFIPVDAVMIAEDGTILSISPAVILANLPEQELSADPVKALLFLKAGTLAARDIKVKDMIVAPMFASAISPAATLQSPRTPAPADTRPPDLDALLRDAGAEPSPPVQTAPLHVP